MRNWVEKDIETACELIKPYMQSKCWNADPDGLARDVHWAISEIMESNVSEETKYLATLALSERVKTRLVKGKPTRDFRNAALRIVAAYLVDWCRYRRLRNDATLDRESAASIITEALRRLGENVKEKHVNDIVREAGDVARDRAFLREKFGFDVVLK